LKARLLRKNRKQGQLPGTLEAPKGALAPRMQVFAYDVDNMEERDVQTVAEIAALRKKWPMLWVNVSGLGDPALIGDLGKLFNLHPLALEDVLHTPQRSKIDEYEDNIFMIVRMVESENGVPSLDQLSLFWGDGFVLSIQERPGDVFGPVRERLRKGGRRIKMSHSDYMAYALLDAVVDGYFPVLEHYGDRLDALEERILNQAESEIMREIHKTKRDLNILRLCLWPMREAISKMRVDTGYIREETIVYLRDCHDHVVQILDIIESYRERVSSLNDLYLSSVSNRLNEVMKVLTIISTIFMPLSFIAGVYGMNFDTSRALNMPELLLPYAYPIVMSVMIVLASIMLFFFWRAGWIGKRKKNTPA
jgi:magnesium transporter